LTLSERIHTANSASRIARKYSGEGEWNGFRGRAGTAMRMVLFFFACAAAKNVNGEG
jgi:hypothetical protein